MSDLLWVPGDAEPAWAFFSESDETLVRDPPAQKELESARAAWLSSVGARHRGRGLRRWHLYRPCRVPPSFPLYSYFVLGYFFQFGSQFFFPALCNCVIGISAK